jgi:hypothetical protein
MTQKTLSSFALFTNRPYLLVVKYQTAKSGGDYCKNMAEPAQDVKSAKLLLRMLPSPKTKTRLATRLRQIGLSV